MDRKGPEQAWPLLHLACPEDGRVRCIHQRAVGTRLDQHPPEVICRPDQPESQDSPDPRQQPSGMSDPTRSRGPSLCFHANTFVTGCSDSEQRVPVLDGHHRWREDIPPGPRDLEGRIHACDEGQLGRLPSHSCLRPEVPSRTHLGPVLQHRRLRHRNLRQLRNQEEAPRGFEKEAPGGEPKRRLSGRAQVLSKDGDREFRIEQRCGGRRVSLASTKRCNS